MAAQTIVGRWRLVSWTARNDRGAVSQPLGESVEGVLVYTSGGWMTAMLAANGRSDLSTADVVGGSEAERASAFSTFIAYSGTYEVAGDVVVHRIALSLFPNWAGGEQRRHFELSGGELLLRTPPLEVAGDRVVNELRWIREE